MHGVSSVNCSDEWPVGNVGKLAILGYHKVGKAETDAWGTWNYVSTDTFEGQLRTLSELGWEVLDAERFLSGVLGQDPFLPAVPCSPSTMDTGAFSKTPCPCCNGWDTPGSPSSPRRT